MSRGATFAMIGAVLCAFALILIMNISALFGVIPSRYISPNDVRGMAVEHNGLLYTLNFEQQNQLVEIFNHSSPTTSVEFSSRKVSPEKVPEITKIIIYRFDEPDVEIIPIGYVSKKNVTGHNVFVFTSSEWGSNGLLEEAIPDQAINVLLTTY